MVDHVLWGEVHSLIECRGREDPQGSSWDCLAEVLGLVPTVLGRSPSVGWLLSWSWRALFQMPLTSPWGSGCKLWTPKTSCPGQKLLPTLRSGQNPFSSAPLRFPKVKVDQLCPTLCDPMDYRDHGILQARILEWVAIPFSRGSSQPRSPTLQADSLPAEPQGRPRGCLLALWYRSRKRRFVPQEPLTCHVQPLIKGGYCLSSMTIAVKQASGFVRCTKSTNDRWFLHQTGSCLPGAPRGFTMCGHHNGLSQAELRTGQRVLRKEGCLLELSGPRIGDRDPLTPVLKG